MPPKHNPNSARQVVWDALDSNHLLTVDALLEITKERELRVTRDHIHNVRTKYWQANPDRRPARDEVYASRLRKDRTSVQIRLNRNAQQKFAKLNLEAGDGISYHFFGALPKESRTFILEELTTFEPPITLAAYLGLLIIDARLDKEETEAAKKRVKSWIPKS